MNNQRRKHLEKINQEISTLKDELESILSDKEFAFDNTICL